MLFSYLSSFSFIIILDIRLLFLFFSIWLCSYCFILNIRNDWGKKRSFLLCVCIDSFGFNVLILFRGDVFSAVKRCIQLLSYCFFFKNYVIMCFERNIKRGWWLCNRLCICKCVFKSGVSFIFYFVQSIASRHFFVLFLLRPLLYADLGVEKDSK